MPALTVTLNPSIDKNFDVERVVPERKLMAGNIRRFPGGGGINVARVICRLGGQARALWSCGGGPGALLAELLDAESVAHEPVPIRASVRENLIAYDISCDQHYRFGMPGPDFTDAERETWLARVRALGADSDFIVFSGSVPPDVSVDWYGDLIRAAPARARLVVDTKRQALQKALEIGVYLIKPNIHELEEMLGRDLDGDRAIGDAARELIDRGGAEVVLVSLGRGGALVVTVDGALRLSAPQVRVRSKVGAGDSMVGGVITALLTGASVTEAARYGVAAGAAAVMSEGTDLCRPEDVERLVAEVDPPEVVG
jgi:6-phosphofructokinase 2